MAYCEVSDITEEMSTRVVAQLSNDSNGQFIDEDVVTKYINEASQYIDTYLLGKYQLPLVNSHILLKTICIEIVKYKLLKRRQIAKDVDYQRYNDAIKELKEGQFVLSGETQATTNYGKYKVSDLNPVYAESILSNYLI